MDRTAGSQALEAVFEGWNIGAVSVKRVRLHSGGRLQADLVRHGGDPARAIHALLQPALPPAAGAMVTGSQAVSFLDLPYLPESICLEAALAHLDLRPDLVLSLGGETFVAYCMSAGSVRRMISSNRCAAGSGEFLVQQFGRMNLDLAGGIAAASGGRCVPLASRCSVHCKSDATHRLNKGECTPADIACSLIANLAAKIAALVAATGWPHRRVLLAGGLAQCEQLTAEIARLLAEARLETVPESPWLEAAGAAFAARRAGPRPLPDPRLWLKPADAARLPRRRPLADFLNRVVRLPAPEPVPLAPGCDLILALDAGSTTTKAILFDIAGGRAAANCYLRTHGNPVHAAFECLAALQRQVGATPHRIVHAAVTGSGREVVSLYLDNCPVFNEIVAHARAARERVPGADTLFEIGGQDAKFVGLQDGVPVDYSMNDGCSAGTGSFLEEAASS
ncbi:MAG: activase, partial [Acidobacteria bacterium]|nr:activase [Acidobacteriota bacterium]